MAPRLPALAGAPRVGVSSCLLGTPVRYDGGHRRNRFLADELAAFVEFVPRCPEAAIGLGTPRTPIRLVANERDAGAAGGGIADVAPRLRAYAQEQAEQLADLCGYVFKSKSPSCGLRRIPYYDTRGLRTGRSGRGLYAERLTAALPWLPVEDEDRLADPVRRDHFLTRIFTLHRFRTAVRARPGARALVAFHTEHKLLLLAHDVAAYRRLGRLVADAGNRPWPPLATAYRDGLMAALARPARIPGHVNVLQHLAGYLRAGLDPGARGELARRIGEFQAGRLPRTAVLRLLHRHFHRHPDPWVARQAYLAPYPAALAAGRAVPPSSRR